MASMLQIRPYRRENITAQQLCEYAPIPLVHCNAPTGKENVITDSHVVRPQFALTGYFELFSANALLVFGRTEIAYLQHLGEQGAEVALQKLFGFSPPAVLLTHDQEYPSVMLQLAEQQKIALLKTSVDTATTIDLLSDFLEVYFAPSATVHGSFVDVYGIGVLFVGKSGIGKSEIALDLVERGHRLVADDIVLLSRPKKDIVIGRGTEISRHFMEIRGLGIIDVRAMFGVRAIRYQKRLEIVVELEEWDEKKVYERTGLNITPVTIFDTEVSSVLLPIYPGKNITVIAETIALNYLLRMYGYDAARTFAERQKAYILNPRKGISEDERRFLTPYFYNDFE